MVDVSKLPEDHAAFLARVGEDIRQMRETLGATQQELGDYFDWNRDAVCKVETGVNQIKLYDFLRLLRYLREADPEHPAIALADRYMGKKQGPKLRVVE